LKTVADPWTTFIYERQQNEALTPSATKGTPRLSVLAMMEGAFPASAKAYKVREAIYRSELEADITNNRIHAFKKPGRTRNVNVFRHEGDVYQESGHFELPPRKEMQPHRCLDISISHTKVEILALVAKTRSGELYGKIMPRRKTLKTNKLVCDLMLVLGWNCRTISSVSDRVKGSYNQDAPKDQFNGY
jgi:hypothetical protein